jgi:hypothetical protein
MTWKSGAASGLGIVAMSLWGMLSQPAAPDTARAAVPRAMATPPSSSDIERQAEKLQARLHPDESYSAPSRNPFRFGAAPAPARPRLTAPAPAAAPLVVAPALIPQAPRMSLAGVATDVVDGATQRTAIVSTPAGVQLVKEGDAVEPGYRVAKIEEDAVELVGGDGQTRRLSLVNPKGQVPTPKTQ